MEVGLIIIYNIVYGIHYITAGGKNVTEPFFGTLVPNVVDNNI